MGRARAKQQHGDERRRKDNHTGEYAGVEGYNDPAQTSEMLSQA
jgi:hypothetical protein